MSNRNDLRSKALSSGKVRKEIKEIDGLKYEIRQPSVGVRNEIFDKSRDDKGEINPMLFLVWAIIYLAYVPESDERVFEEGDFPTLMNTPAGGIVDELGSACSKVLGVEEDERKK